MADEGGAAGAGHHSNVTTDSPLPARPGGMGVVRAVFAAQQNGLLPVQAANDCRKGKIGDLLPAPFRLFIALQHTHDGRMT